MDNSFSLLEFAKIVSKLVTGMQKIHKRDEKAESKRHMNSLSKDGSEIEVCGSVNGVAEEHSRIAMKHFSNSSIEKRRTAEIMGRRASSLATFGISLCSLYLKCSKPVLQAQPPHPLWFDIIGMLSFTLFACAASVMLLVEARFTHIQITVMLIAFFALVLA